MASYIVMLSFERKLVIQLQLSIASRIQLFFSFEEVPRSFLTANLFLSFI